MKIGVFEVDYLSHVCFLFRTPGGVTVLTDPLYSDGFTWRGKFERYLSPPDLPREQLPRIDVLFVSHIHGDHYDQESVDYLLRRDGCRIWAPAEVIEDVTGRADRASVSETRNAATFDPIADGESRGLGDMTVSFHAGYDGSLDDRGRANKYSMLLQCRETTIFYSGDCHEPPPALIGSEVDAIIAWPHPDDDAIQRLATAISASTYVLMHGDRFEPGDFYCNMDFELENRRVQRLLPHVTVVIPQRSQPE